jgi:hypothetical protein
MNLCADDITPNDCPQNKFYASSQKCNYYTISQSKEKKQLHVMATSEVNTQQQTPTIDDNREYATTMHLKNRDSFHILPQ